MIEVRFFSDINFSGFLEDAEHSFGKVPGAAEHSRRALVMTPSEFSACEGELRDLVRDYGGQITHRKV